MHLGLKGKKALVCAATKGLGRAVAESLAAEGVELFICSRDEAALRALATTLRQQYKVEVHYGAADLSDLSAATAIADAAVHALGAVDILVNNIGGPKPSPALTTDIEAWQQGFEQVFLSAVRLTQRLAPMMMERAFGRIITITSLSVVEPIEHLVVSNAMRAAITGFSKTLANEVASRGVTVNTVMPGVIHTDRIEDLRRAKASREGSTLAIEMEKTAAHIPMRRLGRPEELAHVVCFLASEAASYITGANIPVDGGMRRSW